MGNNQSLENQSDQDLSDYNGFHVLKVKPNSPAEKAGLNPYFDFIVSINDQTTITTLKDFAIYISRFANQDVKLSVFSLKTRSIRELILNPTNTWSPNPKDGLLGCSDIHPRSPADRAGLQAHSDYIVGCEYRSLEDENDFYDLIEEHEGKLLSLLVYNQVWDNCREVVILPKRDWGGEGLLGCGVASGLLHRVPIKLPEQQDENLNQNENTINQPHSDNKDNNDLGHVPENTTQTIPTEIVEKENDLNVYDNNSSTPGALLVEPQELTIKENLVPSTLSDKPQEESNTETLIPSTLNEAKEDINTNLVDNNKTLETKEEPKTKVEEKQEATEEVEIEPLQSVEMNPIKQTVDTTANVEQINQSLNQLELNDQKPEVNQNSDVSSENKVTDEHVNSGL
ncbi:hypothetical protein K502DRAFT_327423 [Neoconidiobolus thromboides FSU 785]|nr:hypothetical protein K502DRAFT_327423 [Neoconidiobolus thromboides FSU 785]